MVCTLAGVLSGTAQKLRALSFVMAGAKCVDSILDCKSSANQLVMPAPVAVAHGDANLAIEDFLKSVS